MQTVIAPLYQVVICLKISTFVVSKTTKVDNNSTEIIVVICLKISTFVVSKTTYPMNAQDKFQL